MKGAAVTALVPMAHVGDINGSIAFYEKIGLKVANSVTPKGASTPVWVLLRSVRAELMLTHASEPVIAAQQAVLFYTYTPDIDAAHATLVERGLSPGPIGRPFYNPGGEFRLTDPDGYVVYVAQI